MSHEDATLEEVSDAYLAQIAHTDFVRAEYQRRLATLRARVATLEGERMRALAEPTCGCRVTLAAGDYDAPMVGHGVRGEMIYGRIAQCPLCASAGALRAALTDVIESAVEFDDDRVGYVVMQIDRGDLARAQRALAPTPETPAR
jgi:hypothetical protein